ncbi:MAG TPA: hypothetical protein VGB59_07735 [Allosphingosinicella sp.]|jgi:hypothetical protein
MSILCALGGHEAGSGEIYNGGYYFSRCRRCERDMIRCGAAWQTVPNGHKVVWKSGRHHHSVEPDYAGALPVLHREANLPAVRTPFASWSRDMVRLKRMRRPAPAVAATADAEVQRQQESYPKLLIAAALVGAGIQLLLSFGSGRGSLG